MASGYRKEIRLLNKFPFKILFIGSSLILLIVQLIFFILFKHESNKVLDGLNSTFRNEMIATNPFLISREILDLESAGIIQCPGLSNENTIYIQQRDCFQNYFTLNQLFVSKKIKAITGVTWHLSAYIPANKYFLIALWLTRILFVFIYFLLLLYLRGLKITHQLKIEKSEAMERIARQVAHDIASPLTSINLVASSLNVPAKEKEMIISAVKRILAMTDELVLQHKSTWKNKPVIDTISNSDQNDIQKSTEVTSSVKVNEPINILKTVDMIVSEKRLQFTHKPHLSILLEVDESDEIMLAIDEVEISRVISNLINNSIEAIESPSGKVTVAVRSYSDKVVIEVRDNGKGIPEHIIEQLGQMGFSYGKESSNQSGSGLGLFHAKNTVEAAGGLLDIQSKVGFGTVMRMTFKKKFIF